MIPAIVARLSSTPLANYRRVVRGKIFKTIIPITNPRFFAAVEYGYARIVRASPNFRFFVDNELKITTKMNPP